MKNIGLIAILAMLAFGCNSPENKKTEESTQEINMEQLVEVTIPVHGMTCEGCENAVKKSIGTLAGIDEVSASHVDSLAVVSYDKSKVTREEIELKIADAGYTVAN
ncbi:MAG: cation transporter [Bacteroidales bacterium]|nr:cation transporter [Bacteroidales bacterium]